jgi:hypothetical protein
MNYTNTSDDFISKVVFNNIDNSSSSTNFSDFTAISTDVVRGQTYTLSVDVTVNGSWTQHAMAWFDWNNNCDFDDAGEEFDLGQTPGNSGTHNLTVNVTIPEDAVFGNVRMRVAEYFNSNPTSCQNSNYGEGEDYTVNVTDGVPENLSVQNETITDGQTECYNASSTITVAGSGSTVDILSGGDASFIAGENVLFKPGFHSHSGSLTHAYITLTGDYCSSIPPIIAVPDSVLGEPLLTELFSDNKTKVNIYPNPTTGVFSIDFMGELTTAEIILFDLQGNLLIETNCTEQLQQEMDISHLQMGMYIVAIKTQEKIITRKVIKNY